MPQWAGSCWYELRYLDPTNDERVRRPGRSSATGWARSRRATAGGVDLYVGGVEHAVLHLLYARFWHKVLFDLGHVSLVRAVPPAVQPGLIQAYAYTDARGIYVPAEEVVERDGDVLLRRRAGQPRVRQDGQVAEERGHPGRDVRRVRRRHVPACTRCRWARWTCPARGRPARWSARTGSCSGSGASSSTSRPARPRVTDAEPDEATLRAAAPDDRRRPRRHGRRCGSTPPIAKLIELTNRADRGRPAPARRGRWPSRWC